jgi:hypothetical protein
MNNKTIIAAFLLTLLTGTLSPAYSSQEPITMNLPESVVKTAITKSLPLDFKLQSDTLLGSISIDKIENLQFQKNKLSSRITLSGHELNLVTSIGGHNLQMKIGTLTMSFQCDATIRFDAASQTLFIKPVITDLQSSNNQKGDIASAIVLLFNNREFPLQIEKIQPIVADTGNKFLNISMDIANIGLQPDSLLLSITPIIEATKKERTTRHP